MSRCRPVRSPHRAQSICRGGPARLAAAWQLPGDADGTVLLTGVQTNLPFHQLVLADAEFQAGGFDTGFVARLIERRDTAERARNG